MDKNKRFSLTTAIFIGIAIGVLCGSVFADQGWLMSVAVYLADVFLRLLKMLIIPLVAASIISGVAGIGSPKNVGSLGLKTIVYYLVTSLLAILTGLFLVNMFDPGVGVDLGLRQEVEEMAANSGDILEIFKQMIPLNIVDVMANDNILPVIFFCILFGLFITKLPDQERRESLITFFKGFFEVMMAMTTFVMYLAPVGVWAIITKVVATTGYEAFSALGIYALCVVLGLVIHAGITLPLVVYLFGRVNPLKLVSAQTPALITAFSTASSSATLPLTIECIEQRAGVSNKISSFVLPLGATVNMDGTALYECVATMFIAQAYGIELNASQQFTVVIMALLASIGAAGIPMAGLVMITMILSSVGLPLEGVGLIIAVDRILDMCRTTVNVWSDCCGAVVVASLEGEKPLRGTRGQE